MRGGFRQKEPRYSLIGAERTGPPRFRRVNISATDRESSDAPKAHSIRKSQQK